MTTCKVAVKLDIARKNKNKSYKEALSMEKTWEQLSVSVSIKTFNLLTEYAKNRGLTYAGKISPRLAAKEILESFFDEKKDDSTASNEDIAEGERSLLE